MITVNADSERTHIPFDERLSSFKKVVGENRVPGWVTGKDLTKNSKPKVLHEIISNEIMERLTTRNGVLSNEQKIQYMQLFHFIYEDGAQMLTVGGIIYTENQKSLLEKCSFSDFNFIKSNNESYKIKVPNLTFREIHFLNQNLPRDDEPLESFIPKKEIDQYSKIYRYFPTFTEAEV